jgi:ATP-dependent protease ClpP protease subunit
MMLRLDGIVGLDFSARFVAEALRGATGLIDVVVSSPGGDAFEAAAVFAELKAAPADVRLTTRGVAASAGSLIAMAGDEIVIDAAAVMMIHDPAAAWASGRRTSEDHRRDALALERITSTYANVYASRTGNTPEDVLSWTAAETWMRPDEAVLLGFADRITGDASARPQIDRTTFDRLPPAMRAIALNSGFFEPVTKENAI